MKTLESLIRPMVNHHDRYVDRLPLLHTERSKGEQVDTEIKAAIESEIAVFTRLIDHMRKLAIEKGGEPLEIVKSTIELCRTEWDEIDPYASAEARALWQGYHAAYLRMTMLDPALYPPL